MLNQAIVFSKEDLVKEIADLARKRGYSIHASDSDAKEGFVIITIGPPRHKVREQRIYTPTDEQIIDSMSVCSGCGGLAERVFGEILDDLLSGTEWASDAISNKMVKYQHCVGNCPPVNLALSLGWKPQMPHKVYKCPSCEEKVSTLDTDCPHCSAMLEPLDESIKEGEIAKCGNCDELIPGEATKCPNCKTSFAKEEEPPKPTFEHTEISRGDQCYCTKCGMLLKLGEKLVIARSEVIKGKTGTGYYHTKCHDERVTEIQEADD